MHAQTYIRTMYGSPDVKEESTQEEGNQYDYLRWPSVSELYIYIYVTNLG